jgi:hypothetical protein
MNHGLKITQAPKVVGLKMILLGTAEIVFVILRKFYLSMQNI